MLVLTRREGESVIIGDDIVIVVKAIRSGRVQLGIEASRETSIRRGELEPKDDERGAK